MVKLTSLFVLLMRSDTLAEFESLGHEFELWSQRLVTVQENHDNGLVADGDELKNKYLEQGEPVSHQSSV